MAQIFIRKAEKSDLLAIQKLLSTYFLDMEELKPEDFILAEIEGEIKGCAALVRAKSEEKEFLEIHSIAVHPNYRGKGIGRKLIKCILESISDSTCKLYVKTTVPLFFEKMGFRIITHSEKLALWEECKKCEYFDACKQYLLQYNGVY